MKNRFILAALCVTLLLLVSGCETARKPNTVPPCGDGACESNEDCASCERDCGTCKVPIQEPIQTETDVIDVDLDPSNFYVSTTKHDLASVGDIELTSAGGSAELTVTNIGDSGQHFYVSTPISSQILRNKEVYCSVGSGDGDFYLLPNERYTLTIDCAVPYDTPDRPDEVGPYVEVYNRVGYIYTEGTEFNRAFQISISVPR